MIDGLRKNLRNQLDDLSTSLEESYHKHSPEGNFAHYVFYQANSQIPFLIVNDADISILEPNQLSQAPLIATIGYGLACGRQFSETFLENWSSGVSRLSGRDTFPSDHASFFYRPTELLGIVLGISYYYSDQNKELKWLQEILVNGEMRLAKSDLWTFLVSAYAASLLSVNWTPRVLPFVKDMSIQDVALIKWLCTIDSKFSNRFGLGLIEIEINKALTESLLELSVSTHDCIYIAPMYFSLKNIFETIIQLCWNDVEQVNDNPQTAIEWLIKTFDNVHDITNRLQFHFLNHISPQDLNIRTMRKLKLNLARLRSDTDTIDHEINEQINLLSSPFIAVNNGIVNTGDNNNVTQNRNESITNQTNVHAPNANIGFINSGSGAVSNFSQNIGINIDEITQLINSLRETAQKLPEPEREEVLMHLDDLQEDVSSPEKRKPEKIKVRLKRLLAIAATVLVGFADFSNNVLELSEKLGVPIEINHSQAVQKLSPSSTPSTNKL
jgi:hypothetical protein